MGMFLLCLYPKSVAIFSVVKNEALRYLPSVMLAEDMINGSYVRIILLLLDKKRDN